MNEKGTTISHNRKKGHPRRLFWLILALIGLLAALGLWNAHLNDAVLVSIQERPVAVMGTDCLLVAVVPNSELHTGNIALQKAEGELRRVEALMSTYLTESEISRFNRAQEQQHLPLSPSTLDVLTAARNFFHQTAGAFDVTCRPLIDLWRQAEETGNVPTASDLILARATSDWSQIELTDRGVRKTLASVRVDLGGIAKGYAIDRALQVLQDSGCVGGLVEVGGDLRCFGREPDQEGWNVQVRNPFSSGPSLTISLTAGAVCTSGNYARYFEIDGQKYSHIVDPRTGRPADTIPAVTVIAPLAITADAWATALSVLGSEGLESLSEDIEAMLILSDGQSRETDGFSRHLGASGKDP